MAISEVTIGISGASGAPYTIRLVEALVKADVKVSVVISTAGYLILRDESQLELPGNPEKASLYLQEYFASSPGQISVYSNKDWYSKLASGSSAPKNMVVCPCSVGCLASIAMGASDNLLERAADVVIKEQGNLIMLVREMPLSAIHLQHMLSLAKLGVKILPASPGFYFNPTKLEDIVDFVVARILDQLDLNHKIGERWAEKNRS